MHSMKKRWIASAVGLAGVAVFMSMTAPAVQAEPKQECELASEWVAAHRDRLPATLGEISEFPIA